jgi:putative DNA primase/helicase
MCCASKMNNSISSFKDAITRAGLTAPHEIMGDGKLHRYSTDNKPSHKNGWYFLHLDAVPWGQAGSWDINGGDAVCHWCEKSGTTLTQAERDTQRQRINEATLQRGAERMADHDAAAVMAQAIWDAAQPVEAGHGYLKVKGINAKGARLIQAIDAHRMYNRLSPDLHGDLLVIPMRNAARQLRSLQFITDGGVKRPLTGGEKQGCYFAIGSPKGRIIVCEGFATGASLAQCTGDAVAVAFDAGNLCVAALAIYVKSSALKIIIAADDDHQSKGNPGMTKATAAALAVGGLLAVPDFGANRPEKAKDFNDLHQIAGASAVKACIDAAINPAAAHANDAGATGHFDLWPELQPLIAHIDAQDFPIDSLPMAVRSAVLEVAGFVKAPVALITTSALSALSLAIQAHTDVERASRLSGPTGLFLLAIADSGERKSTCDGFFTSAIRDYEAREQEAAKPLITAYKSEHDAWDAQRSGLKEKIKALSKDGKPSTALVQQLHDLDADEPRAPKVPKVFYGDATPEGLQYELAKQWPSGGVISSEAGSVFGGHGMGRDSVMRNLAVLNQLWDGATQHVTRRSSESFTVRGARLTMGLQVQEATIRAFFANTKGLARGTGFLARFLVSWPTSTQGMRNFTEAPANWPALATFNNRLTAILNRHAPIDDDGGLTPAMLTLSPEAKAAWVGFHDAIESLLSSGGELYDVRDVASKTADNAARLAALFHTFNGSIGPIDLEAMESAASITAWHLTEAQRFLGELAMPAELANPARLEAWMLDFCRRENTDMVPTREVQRLGPNGLRDKATFTEAVQELAELGRARLVQIGKKRLIQIRPELLHKGAA